MTNRKGSKKTQLSKQASTTGPSDQRGYDDHDDDRISSVVDPPPAMLRSPSMISTAVQPDLRAVRSNSGGSASARNHELPGSSPLPPLTPSTSGQREQGSHRSMDSPVMILQAEGSPYPSVASPRFSSESTNRDPTGWQPVPSRWQPASLAEVTDEEDRGSRRKTSSRASRQRSPLPSGNQNNHGRNSSVRGDRLSQEVSPIQPLQRSSENAPNSSERRTRSEDLPSSSPYPASAEAHETRSLPEQERQEKREGKQRRNRADSIESAELRIAAAKSMQEAPAWSGDEPPADDESDVRPNLWDDGNVRAAMAASAREREVFENSAEFNHRRAAYARSERQLKRLREKDDEAYALQVASEDAVAVNDHKLALEFAAREQRLGAQLHARAAADERESQRQAADNMSRAMAEAIELERRAAAHRAKAVEYGMQARLHTLSPIQEASSTPKNNRNDRSGTTPVVLNSSPIIRTTHKFYD